MSVSAGADRNLFLALRANFPADLDAIAVLPGDPGAGATAAYSWRALDEASARIANLLESLGVPHGARVAAQTDKSVEALILYLAVLRAGRVFLPLNTAYQASEMEYFLEDAEPSMVVCSGKAFDSVSRIADRAGIARVFSLNDDGTGTLLESAAHHGTAYEPESVRADDLAVILYTSGTTGRSKGAMLSHGNLLASTEALHACWGWRPSDVLIHALPIFHVHGLFVAAQGALFSGSRMIWFNRFDAKAVVQRLPEASVFMGVPTLYVRMLQESGLTQEACRHMRLFVAGSAPLLPATFDRWRERTGQIILERYGMSETGMLTSNPCDAREGERRAGTVGFPLPGVQLRIRGRERRALPPRARSAASRSGGRTCSRATGGRRSSPNKPSARTAGFVPETWAVSTSAATW